MNANDYPYSMEPMSQYEMVRHWLESFGKPLDQPFSDEAVNLIEDCIIEEQNEVFQELDPPHDGDIFFRDVKLIDKEKLTKELCDLLWVTYQAAAFFGLPIEQAFRRVYDSNMSKLGSDGKPILRESDQKILKGPNYKPADLGDLFDGREEG